MEIRYFSKSRKQNSFKIANAAAEALNIEAKTVDVDLEEECDILFLVNAMYAATVDKRIKEFLKRNSSKIKLLVNISSSASGSSTYKSIKKQCDNLGIKISDKQYHQPASWLGLNKNRPNEDDLNNVKKFVLNVVNE